MTKTRTVHACGDCGTPHPKWSGQCSGCGAWNTLVEELAEDGPAGGPGETPATPLAELRLLHDIDALLAQPQPTGIGELDRVLGGGLVRRLGHPAGRRARHRQEHAVVAAPGVVARSDALPDRRGEPAAGPAAGGAARRRASGALAGRRDDAARRAGGDRPRPAAARRRGQHPDHRRPEPHVLCRLGHTGPRLRPAARHRGQAARGGDRPRRPRHEGRRARPDPVSSSTSSTPCCPSKASGTMHCACCGPSSTGSDRPTSSACSR